MESRSLFDELNDKPVEIPKPPHVVLRPYQKEAVEAVFHEWESHTSTLVCLPTGCGKSVVFSEVMRQWVERN